MTLSSEHIDTAAPEQSSKATAHKICMLFIEAPGRTEARLMRDAVALAEAGFDVTIIDIENDPARALEEDIQGVHFKHIYMPGWYVSTRFKPFFPLKLAWVLVRCIRHQLRYAPFDLFHVHVEKAFLAGYIAARLQRKPLIFDSPDLPFSDPHLLRSPILKRLSEGLLKRLIIYCRQIITASPFYAREIQKNYPDAAITVIYNVPVYREVQKTTRLHAYLQLDPQVRIALYQGNIQPDRELERLVYAAHFLDPDVVIVMMGKGFRDTPVRLQQLIEQQQVQDRVKIIPPVPYNELLDWTAAADIGLTLFSPDYSKSIRYTLPNKLFEYLMAGLPVLSAPLDAIAEVVNTEQVGYVIASLEPEEIAHGINTLLTDSQALATMQHNALTVAREKFNWNTESRKLIRLYDELLALPEERRNKHAVS